MANPIVEAVRLLRQASHENRSLGGYSTRLKDAADALTAYFTDPPAEEVERLTYAFYDGCNVRNRDSDGIRTVLKAIAQEQP
jgi:hypothetical protein